MESQVTGGLDIQKEPTAKNRVKPESKGPMILSFFGVFFLQRIVVKGKMGSKFVKVCFC